MTKTEMIEELECLGFTLDPGRLVPGGPYGVYARRRLGPYEEESITVTTKRFGLRSLNFGRLSVLVWIATSGAKYFWRRKAAINYIKCMLEEIESD